MSAEEPTPIAADLPVVTAPTGSTYDEVPIGGGQKFSISEFPEEGQPVKPVKKAAKKMAKKEEPKMDQLKTEETSGNQGKENIAGVKSKNSLDELPVGGKGASQFDEKPIGKSNFVMSEFPPEGEEQAEPQADYPMLQKLKSKVAKLRLSGMEDLLVLLNQTPDHPDISQISIANLLKETTPLNMQKILQCFKVWLEKGKNWSEVQASNAIENGHINGKTNSKKLTVQIVDLMYQEKPLVIEMALLVGLKSKTPKIIAGYLAMTNQVLAIYGARKMKYLKPYYPDIVRVLNTEKLVAVKTEGMELLKNAYKWLGKEVVEPLIDTIKQGLKKQLDAFWLGYDKEIVMSAPKDVPEQVGKGKGKKKVDAYDLSEAVDIFKQFNEKWSQGVMAAQKWNQKTRMMEQFVKGASTPKIANTEYRHITQMIKRLINDSNFNVVLWDLRILGVLAKGLRRQFSQVARNMFSAVISKFRDKKTQMIDETFNTLQDFTHAISIEEVLDDIKVGLTDKAPNMKVNLITWIAKFVETKAEDKGELPPKPRDALKELFPLFEKLLADGTSDVRQCMAKAIGKMKLLIGEDFFFALQKNVNKNLASKIQADPKDVKKKAEADMAKSSIVIKGPTGNKKVEQSKLGTKTMPAIKEEAPVAKLECFDEPTFEDSFANLVNEGFPEDELKNVMSGGPKERENILKIMKENAYTNFNCVLRVLKKSMKDWKQVNLMMNKQVTAFLEQRASDINKEQAYVVLPFILERIGDSKFSESLLRIVNSICSRVPGRFLVMQIIAYVKSIDGKKPKLNGDACSLLARIVEFVSTSFVPLPELVEYGKECIFSQFAKKGGIELFCVIYSYIGDQIKAILEDSTYKALENDFRSVKVLTEDLAKPKVQFDGEAAAQNKKETKKPSISTDKRPKVDITADVQRLLPKMNDSANWQNRKDSAESLISIINDNNGKVLIGCIHDLVATLKIRINDPNKGLIKTFVYLTGLVFGAMSDRDLKTYAKTFICALADGLSDKVEANRKQIHLSLNKIGEMVGNEFLLASMGTFLEGEKDYRIEVINFILSHEDSLPRTDTKQYPKGLVACLCDKNKEVRAQAEKLFEKVCERIGMETFRQIAKDQRPAFIKDLTMLFDRFQKQQEGGSGMNLSSSKLNSSINTTSRRASPNKLVEKEKRSVQPPTPTPNKRSMPKAASRTLTGDAEGGEVSLSRTRNLIVNDQYFAPLKTLATERIERQENEEMSVWRFDDIKEAQEQQLKDQIISLFREDLAKRMLSFEHKRVSSAIVKIINLCTDVNYQGHIKQVSDLLMKWVLLRLWGGTPALLTIIEVVPAVMSILEKRNLVLNDSEVDLVIVIIREYFLSAFMNQFKVSESLYTIIRGLIALSSGEKVLRKILKQFVIEFPSIHRHIKKQASMFYRDGLTKLIKKQLMDYIGSEQILQEASKLKELKNDADFIEMLSNRFHERVFTSFGFKLPNQSQVYAQPQSPQYSQQPTLYNAPNFPDREKSFDRGSSKANQPYNQPKSPVMQPQVKKIPAVVSPNIPRHEQSKGNDQGLLTNQSQQFNSSLTNFNPTNPQFSAQGKQVRPPSNVQQSQVVQQSVEQSQRRQFDITSYPAPHPTSPLAKHLSKLLPPSESVIVFFTQLFSQSSQKIIHELQSHAKIIFASILKSVQEMLGSRRDYPPEKIVNQINLLQGCIKCKAVIKHVGELVYHCTSFALTQLVYEDQNKKSIEDDLKSRNSDYKVENFIRAINGVMLRILDNAEPQQVVLILLQLLIAYNNSQQHSIKTVNLIVKCITRVSPNFVTNVQPQQIKDFLLRANEYLAISRFQLALEEFKLSNTERPRPEDSIINVIKSVLIELCRALGSDIWEHYEKAFQFAKYPDEHISSFFTSLNIRLQERPRQRSIAKENQELKSITELLSKARSFDSGMAQLKDYCPAHPEFNPVEYFTSHNYDERFISMVMGALESGNVRKTPRKDREDKSQSSRRGTQHGAELQQKMQKLKQKFQELQPETSIVNQLGSQTRMPPKQEESQIGRPEERTQQIQRRINEMKNKMNSVVNARPRQ